MSKLPGSGTPAVKAPVTFRDHPGNEHPLGCPNCQDTEHLVIDVPMVMHHAVEVWAIDGVTEPEFAVLDSDDIDPDAPIEKVTKVRCLSCRWAYTPGDPSRSPLTQLVQV